MRGEASTFDAPGASDNYGACVPIGGRRELRIHTSWLRAFIETTADEPTERTRAKSSRVR